MMRKKQVQLTFSHDGSTAAPSIGQVSLFVDNQVDDELEQVRRQPQRHLQRYPMSGRGQRMAAPRLSLLGKPIHLSAYKSKYRNTASMRWKMRLRSFLEQPQGFLPWLYHFAL